MEFIQPKLSSCESPLKIFNYFKSKTILLQVKSTLEINKIF